MLQPCQAALSSQDLFHVIFLGCPEVRTFANKNIPPFQLHLPCPLLHSLPSPQKSTEPHEFIMPGVEWAAGICQQPAHFCKLINDISLKQEEQENKFLSFCQGRLVGGGG